MPTETGVSAIIRTYNRAALLPEALDSACAQERPAGEIVVVDDGSEDETPAVLARYLRQQSNVRYVRLPANLGMYRAAQIGYEQTTLPWVAFLDSDDLWLPNHLAVCMAAVEDAPVLSMVYTRYGLVDLAGQLLVDRVREPTRTTSFLTALLLKRIVVQPTRTLYSRSAIASVGGIPHHDVVGDWVLNVRVASRFPHGLRALGARTALFRVHAGQSYARPLAVRDAFIEATDDLYREMPDLPLPRGRVLATSLLHCAIFFWQAGDWVEAWRTLVRAVREDVAICATGGFVAASIRLVTPPAMGRAGRRCIRSGQKRFSRRSSELA